MSELGSTPPAKVGTFQDVLTLLAQFRQEVLQRMDELEDKVDRKFDSLPEQYPSRREFNILAGQVAKLEERVYSSVDKRYHDILKMNQRVDNDEITRLRDETQAGRANTATLREFAQRWQLAIVGWLVALAFFLLQYLPHLAISYH